MFAFIGVSAVCSMTRFGESDAMTPMLSRCSVAETNTSWRSRGTTCSKSRIAGRLSSTISRSASSITTLLIRCAFSFPSWISSRMRPGEPTTMCGFFLSFSICRSSTVPPISKSVLIGQPEF